MKGQVSPEFKRAVEAELKRLQEERPTFGQGGAVGASIRKSDQGLIQTHGQVKRLGAELEKIKRQYSRLFSEVEAQEPNGKESNRLFFVMRALDKAQDGLESSLKFVADAIRAK